MLCSLDDNATRRDITLAYLDLLCKKNADEVTVSDVTRRAGVSRPTFYHYFSGTVDILHHLAVLMLDGMRAAGGGGGMRDLTLEQLVREVFRHMEKNRDVLLAVSDAEGRSSEGGHRASPPFAATRFRRTEGAGVPASSCTSTASGVENSAPSRVSMAAERFAVSAFSAREAR